MQEQVLAPNETIQLHEILTLNNISLTKAVTMSPLASDKELKDIINSQIQMTQNHVKDLRRYLEQSMIAASTTTV